MACALGCTCNCFGCRVAHSGVGLTSFDSVNAAAAAPVPTIIRVDANGGQYLQVDYCQGAAGGQPVVYGHVRVNDGRH